MATNTSALKTFAQETRKKLISLVSTKMEFILTQDTAELRGFEPQISKLKSAIAEKGKVLVEEEVAYTWFNRVMALRYMDANGYTDLKVVTPGIGQMRPEILQEAMAGHIDDDLHVKVDDNPKEAVLYRRLLVAVCNQYGENMPFLFEHICDYTEMLLPDDLLSDQSFVTDIRNGMTDEDCQNVEIMGWLYQFYITDRKDDAEKKKSKKGGLKSDEQAAATQLFTPHWVVRYMVENSLGRIWMTLHPDSRLIDDMPYYIPTPEGQIDIIPEDIHAAQDIRFIDPCMGSGHILVYAFDLFCKMYEEEGYQTREIPALILQNNIYGLDIDRRCYQLASFALTMKGRAYHSRYLRKIVMPNVMALQPIDRDTIDASGSWGQKSLMWQFENIDTIGSLLKVTPEECAAIRVEKGIFGYNQQILKTQAEYLSRKYHCVVTNPPYLGKGLGEELKNYILSEYPDTKNDIMATFMERCLEYSVLCGKVSMINQDSWMFMVTYENYRTKLLSSENHIDSLLHLGPHAFPEIGGEMVKSASFVISKSSNNSKGVFISTYDYKQYFEKEAYTLKAIRNHNLGNYYEVDQTAFTHIEGYPISFWGTDKIYDIYTNNLSVSEVATPCVGLQTADNDRFTKSWFEVAFNRSYLKANSQEDAHLSGKKWFPYNKGGYVRRWYGNQELVVNFENDGRELSNHKGAVLRNPTFYFKECISWGLITGPVFRYYPSGFLFDVAGMSCFFKEDENYYKAIAWFNSKVFDRASRLISPAGKLQVGEFSKMPYSKIMPDGIERISKDNITISKSDWDAHETSWDFQRNPLWEQQLGTILFDMQERGVLSEDATIDDIGPFNLPELLQPLELLVENYQSEWEDLFHQLHRNEEELNRQFIEIYGLQDELTPDVLLEEITILQKGEISIEDNQIVWHKDVIIKQFISWMVGCFMGRYSADKPGLIIASQGQKVEDLDLPAMTLEIDDDGIIPIIQESDFFTDDMTQRIEAGMKALFGEDNFYDNLKYIKACLGQDLREYLYKDYYNDHLQMYSVKGAKRPIYWLFSSKMGDKKKKGYFKALVYMHRIESETLSKLHADYVSPYIDKVEQQLKEAEDDAVRDDLSQARRNKANKLAAELAEKVREVKEFATILAQMSTQRLTIDLDEGVKTNYPKYYPLVEPIKGIESKEE